MPSDECRAKDPSTCRHHGRGGGVMSRMKDAIHNRNFSDYADCREEMEKEAPPLPKMEGRIMFSHDDAENAFLSNYGGEWSVQQMTSVARRILIRREFARLDKAAPFMAGGVVTPEAVEQYAQEQYRQDDKDWDTENEGEKDTVRRASQSILSQTLRKMK